MKKILVLGKRIGNESMHSEICTEQIYRNLRNIGIPVVMDQIRGIKQLFEVIEDREFDKIFLLTYGDWGNDGTIQAMLDSLDVEYTFSGEEESEIMYNKLKTKEFFNINEIPTTLTYDLDNISFPCIIKPISNGGSVQVSILNSVDELTLTEDMLFEEYLNRDLWDEFTVAMFNGVTGKPLKIIINPDESDIEVEKTNIWNKDNSKEILDYEEINEIIELYTPIAEKINNSLNYKDAIRVDFMVKKDLSEIKVLEINGMPILNKGGYVFRSMEAIDASLYSYENILTEMCK